MVNRAIGIPKVVVMMNFELAAEKVDESDALAELITGPIWENGVPISESTGQSLLAIAAALAFKVSSVEEGAEQPVCLRLRWVSISLRLRVDGHPVAKTPVADVSWLVCVRI